MDSPGAHAGSTELRTLTPRRRSYSVATSLAILGQHLGPASVDASVDASAVPAAFGASSLPSLSFPRCTERSPVTIASSSSATVAVAAAAAAAAPSLAAAAASSTAVAAQYGAQFDAHHGAPSLAAPTEAAALSTALQSLLSASSAVAAAAKPEGAVLSAKLAGVSAAALHGALAERASQASPDDETAARGSSQASPDDETAARGSSQASPDDETAARGSPICAIAPVGTLSVPVPVPARVGAHGITSVEAEAAEAASSLTTAPSSLTTAPSSLTTAPSSLGSTSMLSPLCSLSLSSSLPPPPRPKLLCRICECTVDIALMAEHSKICMTDMVVFHVEHSLKKLRTHISSEIKRRDQALSSALRSAETTAVPDTALRQPSILTSATEVPDTAPILSALEGVCAHAHLATSPTTCSHMLAYARELLCASQRLSDGTTASYARQLIRMLLHVAPFLADAHDDAPPPPPTPVAPVTAPPPSVEPFVVERHAEHFGAVAGAFPDLQRRTCSLPTSIRLLAAPMMAPMMAEPISASPPLNATILAPLTMSSAVGEVGDFGSAAPRESAQDSADARDSACDSACDSASESRRERCVERELDSSPCSPLLFPISSDARSSGTKRSQGTTARRSASPAAWDPSRRTPPPATAPTTAPTTAMPIGPLLLADSLADSLAEAPADALPPFPLPETEVAVAGLFPSSISSTEVGHFTASGGVHTMLIPSSVSSTASARRQRSRPKSHNISSFEILKPISRGAYGHVVLAAMKTTRDLYAISDDP